MSAATLAGLGLNTGGVHAFPAGELPGPNLSWTKMRRLFPLNKHLIYLNNGTMGPSPQCVIDAEQRAMNKINREAIYGGGESELLKVWASFVGCDAEELALTINVSHGINIMATGIQAREGDEVILTGHEHVGNALPWLNQFKLRGIRPRLMELGNTAEETYENFKKAITPKTRIVALPHIPCTTGQVLPVKEICEEARKRGLFSLIDGAHGPGSLDLNLHEMGCDAYASCGHKWMLGPKGTGFLYVRKDRLDEIQTHQVGGYSDTGWDLLSDPPVLKGYVPTAHRYFYGTQNAAIYAGMTEAIRFHEAIGKLRVQARLRELSALVCEGLASFGDRVKILTPEEEISRAGVIAFLPLTKEYAKVYAALREKSIVIRQVPENNLNCLRVSTHVYNSEQEIETLLRSLHEIL